MNRPVQRFAEPTNRQNCPRRPKGTSRGVFPRRFPSQWLSQICNQRIKSKPPKQRIEKDPFQTAQARWRRTNGIKPQPKFRSVRPKTSARPTQIEQFGFMRASSSMCRRPRVEVRPPDDPLPSSTFSLCIQAYVFCPNLSASVIVRKLPNFVHI